TKFHSVLRKLLALVLLTAVQSPAPVAGQATAPCNQIPISQSNPSTSGDPLIPIYCLPDASIQTPTRVTGANDWVDSFGVSGTARLNARDMGYRVFEDLNGANIVSKHEVVGDHWIVDESQPFGGMAMLSPDRTFQFENGKLIVEGDVSAGELAYGGTF